MIYKKIRRNCICILLVLLSCLCLFAACKEEGGAESSSQETKQTQLSFPKNINVDEETESLVWDEVENAIGYIIDINGEEYESQTNRLDIFLIMDSFDETYKIKVKALGNEEGGKESRWSNTKSYRYSSIAMDDFGFTYVKKIEAIPAHYIIKSIPKTTRGRVLLPTKHPSGVAITSIDGNAIKDCPEITSIVIPEEYTVPLIGYVGRVAKNCAKLKRVHLPDSLKVFEGVPDCPNLTEIHLPNALTAIGQYAFSGCTSLGNITLPNTLESLSLTAFDGCTSLKELYIPASVTNIANDGFGGCYDRFMTITIAQENEKYKVDNNCIIQKEDNALIAVFAQSEIPNYITSIARNVFYGANITTLVIPNSVKKIGNNAFQESNLTEIVIPGNVEEIGRQAFGDCVNLRSVTLSEGIKSLGASVFQGCSRLEELSFPTSVENISNFLTQGCDSLTRLIVQDGNPIYKSEGNCIVRRSDNELIAGCKTSVIPDYVKGIGSSAFNACAITELVIPNGVEYIGMSAFSGSSLKKVSLPNTLQSIGERAFTGCSALEYVAIPSSVKEIGTGAFEGDKMCVVLPETVETISSYGSVFRVHTLYTSLSSAEEAPKGWNWQYSNRSDTTVYGCELGYEDGIPYVKSVAWSTENATKISENALIPVREGYTFMGWATEPNSNTVVIGKTTESDGEEYTLYVKELKERFPFGAVLYAVWA